MDVDCKYVRRKGESCTLNNKCTYPNCKVKKEKIICAAIQLDNGKIYYGHRHNHCRDAANGELSWNMNRQQILDVKMIQGFITTDGRFVDRKEGAIIHVNNGGKLNSSTVELYSEDLY